MVGIKKIFLTYIRIGNPHGSYGCSYGLLIRMNHTDSNPYAHQFFFFALRRWKSTKIHHILLTNAHTPLETKYASKSSLTVATYTKSRKFREKNDTGIFSIFVNCWVSQQKC